MLILEKSPKAYTLYQWEAKSNNGQVENVPLRDVTLNYVYTRWVRLLGLFLFVLIALIQRNGQLMMIQLVPTTTTTGTTNIRSSKLSASLEGFYVYNVPIRIVTH